MSLFLLRVGANFYLNAGSSYVLYIVKLCQTHSSNINLERYSSYSRVKRTYKHALLCERVYNYIIWKHLKICIIIACYHLFFYEVAYKLSSKYVLYIVKLFQTRLSNINLERYSSYSRDHERTYEHAQFRERILRGNGGIYNYITWMHL